MKSHINAKKTKHIIILDAVLNSPTSEKLIQILYITLNTFLVSATHYLSEVLFFAFQWRLTAGVVILFIQHSSRLLQHSSPSVWPVWWFAAHLKPQSCDLLVGVTTNPPNGWPSLPLRRCGPRKHTRRCTHSLSHIHIRLRKKKHRQKHLSKLK